MAYPFPADVKQLVADRMESGGYQSEDELLRDALRALTDEEHDLGAVREAISEWRAGDEGVPLDDAFDQLRERHPV